MKKPQILAVVLMSAGILSSGSLTYAAQTWFTDSSTPKQWMSKQFGKWMRQGKKWMMGKWIWKWMMWMAEKNPAVEKALLTKDYVAFQTAVKWTPMEKEVTQDKFNKMVEWFAKRQSVEKAIESNNYEEFVKAYTPTIEEFTNMVKMNIQKKAIEAAIVSKSYSAFLIANKWTPMEWKVTQAQFDKMVEKHANKTAE